MATKAPRLAQQDSVDDAPQDTELAEAVLARDLTRVKKLLAEDAKAQLKVQDRDNWLPLHYALWSLAQQSVTNGHHRKAAQQSKSIYEALLAAGADASAANISGVTCLHLAAWYGLVHVCKDLLQRGVPVDSEADDSFKGRWNVSRTSAMRTNFNRDADIYKPDSFIIGTQVRPLYLAARSGHADVVEVLLAGGADVNATKSFGFHKGITALHAAAARGNSEIIQLLMDHNADLNITASDGGTALHCACEFGHVDAVHTLLKDTLKVNVHALKHCMEADNITAMHLGTGSNQPDIVKALAKAGADVNKQASDGFSPIHLAAQNGLLEAAQALMALGARLDLKARLDGCLDLTPLHMAVRSGKEDLIELLINHGADIHATAMVSEISGVTCLHLAAVCGHAGAIARLLALGCDWNARTSAGSTALFLAIRESQDQVVKVILEKTNTDLTLPQSAAPAGVLQIAIVGGNDAIVQLLLEHGCDVNQTMTSEDGGIITPLYLAVDNKNTAITRTLLCKGADVNTELKDGFTVLHTAAEQGSVDIIELLLGAGAASDTPATFGELSNVIPLHLTVMNKHIEATKLLVKRGVGINVGKFYQGRGGFTPLYLAVKNGDMDATSVLIEQGADVNKARDDGWTPLHAACEQGHIEIVKLLLAANCDVTKEAEFDENSRVLALHQSAQEGHTEICRLLIKAGTDINAGKKWREESGVSALHLACEAGHESTVKALIDMGCDVNLAKSTGWTALHWACQCNYHGIVRMLLARRAKVHVTASFDEHKDCLPLHQASQHGHTNIVRMLIDAGSSVKKTKSQGENWGISSLHLASALGHVDTVKLLLNSGAEIDAADNSGFTALHFASQNGYLDVIRTLLAARCSTTKRAQADGSTDILALHQVRCSMIGVIRTMELQAAQGGHSAIIKFLVMAGSPVDALKKCRGREDITSLHLAAENGHAKACQILVQLGAVLDASDSVGFTPLHLAAKGDHDSTLEFLLQAGSDPSRRVSYLGADDVRAIHIASQFGHRKILKRLIEAGVELNVLQSFNGTTGLSALHLAAAEGHVSVVRTLVKAGIDVSLVTSDGEDAMSIAKANGFRDIIRILKSKKISS